MSVEFPPGEETRPDGPRVGSVIPAVYTDDDGIDETTIEQLIHELNEASTLAADAAGKVPRAVVEAAMDYQNRIQSQLRATLTPTAVAGPAMVVASTAAPSWATSQEFEVGEVQHERWVDRDSGLIAAALSQSDVYDVTDGIVTVQRNPVHIIVNLDAVA